MDLSIPSRGYYHPNARKLTQLFSSGLVAIFAAGIAGLDLELIGLPGIDYAALHGALLTGQRAPGFGSALWLAGLSCFLLEGALVFPLAYDYLLDRRLLPNFPHIKGIFFGLLLWSLFQITILPLAGRGFFSFRMAHPLPSIAVALVTWLLYGILLEAMTRVPIVHKMREWSRDAA